MKPCPTAAGKVRLWVGKMIQGSVTDWVCNATFFSTPFENLLLLTIWKEQGSSCPGFNISCRPFTPAHTVLLISVWDKLVSRMAVPFHRPIFHGSINCQGKNFKWAWSWGGVSYITGRTKCCVAFMYVGSFVRLLIWRSRRGCSFVPLSTWSWLMASFAVPTAYLRGLVMVFLALSDRVSFVRRQRIKFSRVFYLFILQLVLSVVLQLLAQMDISINRVNSADSELAGQLRVDIFHK